MLETRDVVAARPYGKVKHGKGGSPSLWDTRRKPPLLRWGGARSSVPPQVMTGSATGLTALTASLRALNCVAQNPGDGKNERPRVPSVGSWPSPAWSENEGQRGSQEQFSRRLNALVAATTARSIRPREPDQRTKAPEPRQSTRYRSGFRPPAPSCSPRWY